MTITIAGNRNWRVLNRTALLRQCSRFLVLMTAALIALTLAHRLPAATVVLPAGSVDGLSGAIAAAGPGGVVLVEQGDHFESGTVVINIPVSIIGEPGATINTATTPTPGAPPLVIDAALHVFHADHVTIQGLTLVAPDVLGGGCAVLIERSQKATVDGNTLLNFQFGVLVHYGDHARITANQINITPSANNPALVRREGVTVINGRHADVSGNTISGARLGIFASDVKGRVSGNVLENSALGLLLCNAFGYEISGQPADAQQPANGWHVHKNLSRNNVWGYVVADGANGNVLVNNAANDNASEDILLLGDSFLFGFFTPTSYNNVVAAGPHKDLVIKDCGENNVVSGDVSLVDTSVSPCP